MAAIDSDEFKRDAVRIAQTSGLTRRQVASDSLAGRRLSSIAVRLGVGLSTLNKWVKMVSDETGPRDPDQNLLRENERLRRENRIFKVWAGSENSLGDCFPGEWRELLKKG